MVTHGNIGPQLRALLDERDNLRIRVSIAEGEAGFGAEVHEMRVRLGQLAPRVPRALLVLRAQRVPRVRRVRRVPLAPGARPVRQVRLEQPALQAPPDQQVLLVQQALCQIMLSLLFIMI